MSDRRDYAAIVRDRAPQWRRTAYLCCGDWTRADDLLQTARLRLYLSWHRIDLGGVDAYARTVIARLAIDESRRPWRRAESMVGPPDRPSVPVDVEANLDLHAALQRLPGRQRITLVLRFYGDLSVTDTAKALRVSEGTVKSQTARGLAALRAVLDTAGVPNVAPAATHPPHICAPEARR